MPSYGVLQAGGVLTAIQPGDAYNLWNAEAVTGPQASVAFCTGYSPGGGDPAPIIFTIHFSAAPTDLLVIQASNVDSDALYQTLYTSTNKQDDYYADGGGFAFYRAKMVTGGGTVTVIAKR